MDPIVVVFFLAISGGLPFKNMIPLFLKFRLRQELLHKFFIVYMMSVTCCTFFTSTAISSAYANVPKFLSLSLTILSMY